MTLDDTIGRKRISEPELDSLEHLSHDELLAVTKGNLLYTRAVEANIQTCRKQLITSQQLLHDTQEQLKSVKQDSVIDELTRGYNHGGFWAALGHWFDRTERLEKEHKKPFYLGLLFIDIDNFKDFNDLYGHNVGDFVLAEIGRLALGNPELHYSPLIRNGRDQFCRYGGEEFTVLLPDYDDEMTYEKGEQFRSVIDKHRFCRIPDQTEPHHVTVSVGAASMRPIAEVISREEFVNRADNAMYVVKYSGKNGVCLWTQDTDAEYTKLVAEKKKQLFRGDSPL